MNIKRAKEEIKHAIAAYLEKDEQGEYRIPAIRQRPILLMGPPGIGKTQIMEQIAGECDLALVAYTITHHTRQSAIGLPYIREKVYDGQTRSVTEYTMSEIIASVYDRMEASGKREGILFIDEINCVSETLAPTMLQFLQVKTFGNQKVPEGWIIVAAGNPPEYNRSVREFDVVTLDRVKVIDVEADYPVWKEYAQQVGIHGSILSYLDIHRENFYRMETTVDGKAFVTARGWEDLSEIIYAYERLREKDPGYAVDREVTGQYLRHVKVSKDFANYLMLYYKYQSDYQVDEILDGVIRPGVLNRLKFAPFDERLEVTSLLLSRLLTDFREVRRLDRVTGLLFARMKEFQAELEQARAGAAQSADPAAPAPGASSAASAADIMKRLLDREQAEYASRIKAGQNARAHLQEGRAVIAKLEAYLRLLQNCPEADAGQALELVKHAFREQTQALDAQNEAVLARLEHAFDFMEAAYGEGQEMVMFITELSANRYAVEFLKENPCDRYYMYNKTLLFDDREKQIREELDAIRDLQVN